MKLISLFFFLVLPACASQKLNAVSDNLERAGRQPAQVSSNSDCFLSLNTSRQNVIEAKNLEALPRNQVRLMLANSRPIVQVVQLKSSDERYRLVFDDSGIPNGTDVRTEIMLRIFDGSKQLLSLGTSRASLSSINLDLADQSQEARPDGMISGGLNLYCRRHP